MKKRMQGNQPCYSSRIFHPILNIASLNCEYLQRGILFGTISFAISLKLLLQSASLLLAFPKLEELIYSVKERQTYSVVLDIERDGRERLDELMGECGFRVIGKKVSKSGEEMLYDWEAEGAPENHDQLVERLLLETEVKGFKC
jgi:hypothetical protein